MDTIVLLSGGYDSIYCLINARDYKKAKCVFFNYGQPYLKQEREAIGVLSSFLSIDCEEVAIPPLGNSGDTFLDRNETFISMVSKRKPKEIYFGTRNLLPLFDKHKDSNWWWAKKMSRRLGVVIKTPAVGLPKRFIISKVHSFGIPKEAIFSSEGYTVNQ